MDHFPLPSGNLASLDPLRESESLASQISRSVSVISTLKSGVLTVNSARSDACPVMTRSPFPLVAEFVRIQDRVRLADFARTLTSSATATSPKWIGVGSRVI
ncbi:hypothetical protein HYR99_33050 [Candidatus Poribacteria bacterium]|nr:hypothetical protein [Candidatus Poribacteria bacterium]